MRAFLLLALLIVNPAFSTTFKLQSVDQQVQESDGIMIGHYLKSKSVKLENGKIATQMIFQMKKEHGLQSELFGMDEVIIHYPGGKVGDLRMEVQGTPRFVAGEQVVIFIKSVRDRYWGMNLGMGSYKVVSYGNDAMMINTLFPEDPKMGQMKLADFEKMVRVLKGSQLKTVSAPAYLPENAEEKNLRAPASAEEGKIRTIASVPEQSDNYSASSSFKTFWLVAILGLLGLCYLFAQRRNH